MQTLTINGFCKSYKAPTQGSDHFFRVTVNFDHGQENVTVDADNLAHAQDIAGRTWGERNIYNIYQIC